jgi:hypothetical protein
VGRDATRQRKYFLFQDQYDHLKNSLKRYTLPAANIRLRISFRSINSNTQALYPDLRKWKEEAEKKNSLRSFQGDSSVVARSPKKSFHPGTPMKVSDSSADRPPNASPAHKKPKTSASRRNSLNSISSRPSYQLRTVFCPKMCAQALTHKS